MIEDLRVNGALLPLANPSVAPGPRRVELRFTAPYFGTPERVQFRYRLSGVDEMWVTAGSERAATFARLPAGHYRFEVSATDAEGEWQPRIASASFTVRPAWWETLWLRLAAGLAAAAALAWLVRFIVKRRLRERMRRLEQEHALERERIRIARDMHDQLGANLTQISIASQLVKLDPPDAVASHVEEIAAIARHTVEALDEIVWAVNPHHDTLASLVEYIGKFAVSFLTSSGLAAKVDIPHDLPPLPLGSNVRHHLFLAVKEALNNVVKHAGATTVYLKVEMTDHTLRVIVIDDGRGFSRDTVQADANGLRNMRERMAEICGECRIDGTPAHGTRVICELPLGTNGA
jgi:signal transduction histidine kinase